MDFFGNVLFRQFREKRCKTNDLAADSLYEPAAQQGQTVFEAGIFG
jgi:hypothetical protein